MDILNLPNLNLISVEDTDESILITAEPTAQPKCCQKCGIVRQHNLSKYGKKRQCFMDIPVRGKRVAVYIDRQRYVCRDCGATFFEDLLDMDDSHFATKRLIEYIEQESLRRTFTTIADDVGVNEKTVRNIFNAFVSILNQNYRPVIPKWIGIDEIHVIHRPRCIITNIESRTVIDFLPDRNKQTVIDYFMKMRGKRNIEYVTMDMWKPYKDACNYMMPDAKVIVDKFHIVRMANQAIETVRKSIRKTLSDKHRKALMHDRFILLKRRHELSEKQVETLNSWVGVFQPLSDAYALKEMYYDIWDLKSAYDAYEQYKEWVSLITPETKDAFKELTTAMKNWKEEIFNYFDMPLTNAYTESLNGLIRVTNRMGRGYSFDALRAKLLFTEGLTKVKRPKFEKYQSEGFLMDLFKNYDPLHPEVQDLIFDLMDSSQDAFSTQEVKLDLTQG